MVAERDSDGKPMLVDQHVWRLGIFRLILLSVSLHGLARHFLNIRQDRLRPIGERERIKFLVSNDDFNLLVCCGIFVRFLFLGDPYQ
jgi:hypothetical protein